MPTSLQSRKRKVASTQAAPKQVEKEAVLPDLEGVFSDEEDDDQDVDGPAKDDDEDEEDEDEFDDEEDEDEFDDEEDEDEFDDEEDEEDEDEEDDSIHSSDQDDDEQDIRMQVRNLQARTPTDGDAKDEPNFSLTTDANGNERYVYREINPVYDSDDSDREESNTIGNIPLSFYDSYPHIGYDINGKKIQRPAKGEALDALLDSIDLPQGWTGLTDPATGKPLQLSEDELQVLKKLTRNEAPGEGFDPYPDMVYYFSGKPETMPLSAAPEPKRRFVPSKHEAKRVMKLVKAIKEGRIQPYRQPSEEDQVDDVKRYDIWADEVPQSGHPNVLAAPKLPPPGYEESYHPPPEYLPDKKERQQWEEAEEEDREKDYLPTDHSALRKVPGYARFVKEKFERCLDLYLAPRVRRSKLNIDPESLLPKLPSPDDLRPFPTACSTQYIGHKGRVRSVAVSPTGTMVASGGDDGTVRVWELLTGRQLWSVRLDPEEAVNAVRWRPTRETLILAAAVGESVYFITPSNLAAPDVENVSRALLDAGFGYAAQGETPALTATGERKPAAATWSRPSGKLADLGVVLSCTLRSTVKVIEWHRRGDYLSTVCPAAASQSVAIHTLSKHLTQHPFRRLRGLAQTCSFHPSKPLFFVATRQAIRVYDLQQQRLERELKPGARWISSMHVHPLGDNVLVGSYDRRLLWHDMDLAATPYKTLRYHSKAIRAVRFHGNAGTYPLFADASDDGSVQVFHGKVVADSLENALIVPLKVLRGHKVAGELGVLDLDWHPREPWLVSAGADGTARLWC